MENAANELAWHAQLESYLGTTALHASFAAKLARRVKTVI